MRLAGFVVACVLLAGTARAQGVSAPFPDCPVPNPRDTAAWQAFESMVRAEYMERLSGPSHQQIAMVIGHAYGRVARAVNDQRDRQMAFACIEKSLEQIEAFGLLSQFGLGTGVVLDMRMVRMAGMGMFDREVAALIRGVSSAPATQVFAPAAAAPVVPGGTLAGNWDDGGINTIRVVGAGSGFEGLYTDRLGAGHRGAGFSPGEVGFRFTRADPASSGGWTWRVEIKWRGGGREWWQQGYAERRGDLLLFHLDGVTTSTPWRRIGS